MEEQFADNLRRLANALRYDGFRFILIGHNRFSLYKDIAAWLRNTITERPILELRLRDKTYRQIIDELRAFNAGVVSIPDFDWLLRPENDAIRVAFNQRRDALARLNLAFVVFIEPATFPQIPVKIPDWWSLRSLELDFKREEADETGELLTAIASKSSLGGGKKQEKVIEIDLLLRQIKSSESSDSLLLQSLYGQIAVLMDELGNWSEARSYWYQALTISLSNQDKLTEAKILDNIGQTFIKQASYNTALSYLTRSLSISQQLADEEGQSRTFNNLSQIYKAQGDYNTALMYLKYSLTVQQKIDDKNAKSAILNNIGELYNAQGAYEMALANLLQSLSIVREIGNKNAEATILNNIAISSELQGNYTEALSYLMNSLHISEQTGDKENEGRTLSNIGTIYVMQENYEKALIYLERSLTIQQEIGNKLGEAIAMNSIGVILWKEYGEDKIERSLALLTTGNRMFQEIGSSYFEFSTQSLDAIKQAIGEDRFYQTVRSLPNQPE
jgi:tetratricopeptide (TPR) repeat protein